MLKKNWYSPRPLIQKWAAYALGALTIAIAVAMLSIINYTSNAAKVDSQRVFESSVWNTLQLQIQTYRFRHYLNDLSTHSGQTKGETFFQYDLLMSRIDLLRTGKVGSLISEYSGGRALRLLNIINAELELVSLNVVKIEEGDRSYLEDLVSRLESLDTQINEFVTLTNQGNNQFITDQHRLLKKNLDQVQKLTIFFLISLILLCGFILNSVSRVKEIYQKNKELNNNLLFSEENKSHGLQTIIKEMHRNFDLTEANASTYPALKTLQTAETLLALVQINAESFSLTPTAEKLSRHLNEVIDQFNYHFEHQRVSLDLVMDQALPEVIVLDFINTKHIISALLQHALINNHAEHITIKVRHTLSNKNGSKILVVNIQDDGLGKSNSDLDKLRISPMSTGHADEDELTLKLSLSYKLVSIMGGNLQFSCKEYNGCQFWLELPFHLPNTES